MVKKITADDVVGVKFGRLTVTKLNPKVEGKRYKTVEAFCECSPEKSRSYILQSLREGKTKSCGCLKLDKLRKDHTQDPKWLDSKTKWYNLIHSSKRVQRYPSGVSDGWEDFLKFIDDIGFAPSSSHYLRRHDRKKQHGKDNSYWFNKEIVVEENLDTKSVSKYLKCF